MTFVKIQEETLSDNSVAFNVQLRYGEEKLLFSCLSEKSAQSFATGLQELINSHTVDGPRELV
jgi:hypothetical protein